MDLKKDNTWFSLKSCSCVQRAYQEAFQAHYSFEKLGGYKGLYYNKYYETSNVGVIKALYFFIVL